VAKTSEFKVNLALKGFASARVVKLITEAVNAAAEGGYNG
jgi:hypothetical protein